MGRRVIFVPSSDKSLEERLFQQIESAGVVHRLSDNSREGSRLLRECISFGHVIGRDEPTPPLLVVTDTTEYEEILAATFGDDEDKVTKILEFATQG